MSKVLTIRQKGDFKKSLTFFSHVKSWSVKPILEKYGKLGVERLYEATPKATGKTAASWSYEIKMDKTGATLCWKNANIVDGVPIAVIYNTDTEQETEPMRREWTTSTLRWVLFFVLWPMNCGRR